MQYINFMAKAFNSLNVYVDKTHLVGFGKHEGDTWGSVLLNYPSYVIWCIANMQSPPLFSRDFIIQAIKLVEGDKKAVRQAYKQPVLPKEYANHSGHPYAEDGDFGEWDIPF